MTEMKEHESAIATQVGGDHYKTMGDYQPWIVAAHQMTPEQLMGAAIFTAQTYLARNKNNKREDIEKAAHTLMLYLEVSEKYGKQMGDA